MLDLYPIGNVFYKF